MLLIDRQKTYTQEEIERIEDEYREVNPEDALDEPGIDPEQGSDDDSPDSQE